MKLKDILKDNKMVMTEPLADIMIHAVEEMFPYLYTNCKKENWANVAIVTYACNLDISDQDIERFFAISSRWSKLWAFS